MSRDACQRSLTNYTRTTRRKQVSGAGKTLLTVTTRSHLARNSGHGYRLDDLLRLFFKTLYYTVD